MMNKIELLGIAFGIFYFLILLFTINITSSMTRRAKHGRI